MRVEYEVHPRERFTEATVRKMWSLVDKAKIDPKFQDLVYGIVRGVPWKEKIAELRRVYGWFKKNHEYRNDPHGVELLQDVWATIRRKRFDCDDSSVFLAAAAEVLGNPTRFVTIAADSSRPQEWSHIYPEAWVRGAWVAMDAIIPEFELGDAPKRHYRKKIWTRARESWEMSGENGVYSSKNDPYRTESANMFEPPVPPEWRDAERTYAWGEPGTSYASRRLHPSHPKLVSSSHSQIRRTAYAGGLRYLRPSIAPHASGEDLHTVMPRSSAPILIHDPWNPPPPEYERYISALSMPPYPKSTEMLQEVPALSGLGAISASSLASITLDAAQRTAERTGTSVSDVIGKAITMAADMYVATQQAKAAEAQRRAAEAAARAAAASPARAESGLPGWVIPAGIAAVALFVLPSWRRRG